MKKIIIVFLTIYIMMFCSLGVTAAPSPQPINRYAMHVTIDGKGHAEVDKEDIVEKTNEVVTFSAFPNEKNHFVGWKIEGNYIVVEGNLYSPTIKIIPTSDILAIAIFNDGDGTPDSINTSKTSPKTGQDSLSVYLALALLVVSAILIIVSAKNLKRSNF